jgi:hypothetical protein
MLHSHQQNTMHDATGPLQCCTELPCLLVHSLLQDPPAPEGMPSHTSRPTPCSQFARQPSDCVEKHCVQLPSKLPKEGHACRAAACRQNKQQLNGTSTAGLPAACSRDKTNARPSHTRPRDERRGGGRPPAPHHQAQGLHCACPILSTPLAATNKKPPRHLQRMPANTRGWGLSWNLNPGP